VKTQRSFSVTFVAVTLAVGCVFLAFGDDEGQAEGIAFEALPASVQQAVNKAYSGAKVAECSKEIENGKTTYTVELKTGGREVAVELDDSGTILETTQEIALSQLPAPVSNTLHTVLPDATPKEAERKSEQGRITYDVEMLCDGVKLDIELSGAGKILEIEVERDRDEQGEETEQHGEHED